jgi:hypothetical protein
MAVKTYDPTRTTVTLGNVDVEGFGPDTFIEVAPSSPRFVTVQCCEGQVVRTAPRDQSGTVRITLLPTSPSNADLDVYRQLDDGGGAGVFSLQIRDDSAGVNIHAAQAWVAELPRKVVSGSGLQMHEWTIACASINWDFGGDAAGAFSLSGLVGAAVNFVAGHLPFPV